MTAYSLMKKETLQVLFDVIVASVGCGAGSDHVDEDDIAAILELAKAIAVDPLPAIPEKYRCQIEKTHGKIYKRRELRRTYGPFEDEVEVLYCNRCGLPPDTKPWETKTKEGGE